MEEYVARKSISFTNKSEAISDTLKQCLGFINEKINKLRFPASSFSRIKWVITEFLTNGVKHSGVTESVLSLEITRYHLIIEKKDSGNPLVINVSDDLGKISWPLGEHYVNKNLKVYDNGIDSLKVHAPNRMEATFFVEEKEELQEQLPIESSEHFGLLIITKSSHLFTYKLDVATAVNTFRSVFELLDEPSEAVNS